MKRKTSIFFKSLCIVLAAYIVYAASFALVPYFIPKDVSPEFISDVEKFDFYGDSPSVDRATLVEDPLISLGTRLRMINDAEERIDIAYYSLIMGETTDSFLAAVLDAADRGVKVRLLLDGMSHGFSDSYKHLAEALGSHENIEFRLYNPINILKPWTINGRMHDKYIIIDNKLLLLGGRNIGDKYFAPEGYDKNLSIDRDVLIYNTACNTADRTSAVFQVRQYMDNVWHRSVPAFENSNKKSEAEKIRLRELITQIHANYGSVFSDEFDYEKSTFPTNKITFFANDIDIYKKEPKVGEVIHQLLTGAEKKVLLQSPYVVLSDNLRETLEAVGKMDIEYEILTNSMQSSPNLPAYSLYLNDKEDILKTGAKIYEFQNNDAIHAKTFVIDGRMSVVGSFNMDPRSEYIDTEIMLAIDSEEFTAYLSKIINMYKEHSLVVGGDGQYIPSGNVEPYPVKPAKRTAFRVVGKVLSPFRVLV